jgi:hypothetical protein
MAGEKEFKRKFAKAMKGSSAGAVRGLRLGMTVLKIESKRRAPKDEGLLRVATHTDVDVGPRRATGTIFNLAEYAAAVHEMERKIGPGGPRRNRTFTDSSGKKHTITAKGFYWEVGEPKFMQNAIDEKKGDVLRLIHKFAKL